jgi:hypothetical protein
MNGCTEKEKKEFDRRLKEAAVTMRRNWDRHNAERGWEVDYDTLSKDYPYDSDSGGENTDDGDGDDYCDEEYYAAKKQTG